MGVSGDWETGTRRPWPSRITAAAVAVAAAVALVVANRDRGDLDIETGASEIDVEAPELDVVVQPPSNAGGRWLCPVTLDVIVHGGRTYPPTHPDRPSLRQRPQACYRDVGTAVKAGYPVARTPPDAELVVGLYLVPTGRLERDICQGLADQLGYAVPCARRLPHPVTLARCPASECAFLGGYVREQRGFPLPGGWCAECDAEVFLTAAPAGDPRSSMLVTCPGLEGDRASAGDVEHVACLVGPPWVAGDGGFPHEGHVLTRWTAGGIVYGVSVEGHGPAQRRLLAAIVDSVVLVPPRGAGG